VLTTVEKLEAEDGPGHIGRTSDWIEHILHEGSQF